MAECQQLSQTIQSSSSEFAAWHDQWIALSWRLHYELTNGAMQPNGLFPDPSFVFNAMVADLVEKRTKLDEMEGHARGLLHEILQQRMQTIHLDGRAPRLYSPPIRIFPTPRLAAPFGLFAQRPTYGSFFVNASVPPVAPENNLHPGRALILRPQPLVMERPKSLLSLEKPPVQRLTIEKPPIRRSQVPKEVLVVKPCEDTVQVLATSPAISEEDTKSTITQYFDAELEQEERADLFVTAAHTPEPDSLEVCPPHGSADAPLASDSGDAVVPDKEVTESSESRLNGIADGLVEIQWSEEEDLSDDMRDDDTPINLPVSTPEDSQHVVPSDGVCNGTVSIDRKPSSTVLFDLPLDSNVFPVTVTVETAALAPAVRVKFGRKCDDMEMDQETHLESAEKMRTVQSAVFSDEAGGAAEGQLRQEEKPAFVPRLPLSRPHFGLHQNGQPKVESLVTMNHRAIQPPDTINNRFATSRIDFSADSKGGASQIPVEVNVQTQAKSRDTEPIGKGRLTGSEDAPENKSSWSVKGDGATSDVSESESELQMLNDDNESDSVDLEILCNGNGVAADERTRLTDQDSSSGRKSAVIGGGHGPSSACNSDTLLTFDMSLDLKHDPTLCNWDTSPSSTPQPLKFSHSSPVPDKTADPVNSQHEVLLVVDKWSPIPTEDALTKTDFVRLNYSDNLLRGLEQCGIVTPSAFQAAFLLAFSQGFKTLIEGQAGIGKSLCYVAGITNKIDHLAECIQAVVITETATVANQVLEMFLSVGAYCNIRVLCCQDDGSARYECTYKSRRNSSIPQIVVGTADKLMKALKLNGCDFARVHTIVADDLYDMYAVRTMSQDLLHLCEVLTNAQEVVIARKFVPDQLALLTEQCMERAVHVVICNPPVFV